MPVLQPGLILTDPYSGWGDTPTLNNPVICYDNRVTTGNVTAGSSDADYPVTNVANPATDLFWKGAVEDAANSLTVALAGGDEVDYVGIAGHNLGSTQRSVGLSADTGSGYSTLIAPVTLGSDSPALWRFTAATLAGIRLDIGAGAADSDLPTIAVLFVGKSLLLQRRIYVGHTPIVYGRRTEVTSGRSESGAFLGRIVTGESRATGFTLANMTPEWYRAKLDPFLQQAQENTFFFAWRPGDYPLEVGYAWLTNDAVPKNSRPNGMMSIDLQMGGVV